MKIDTLFLSACGSKISGYVGVFRALLETKIIELDKIKRYVCCSSGAIIGFNICCGLSLPIMQNLSFKINYLELYDLNDLDDLFEIMVYFQINESVILLVPFYIQFIKHEI